MVETTEIYPYASGPLLDDRNTYTYTPYHGTRFIDAWRADRSRVRVKCDPGAAPSSDQALLLETLALPARTTDLLRTLRQRIEDGPLSSEDESVLKRLIQRFEVSKRIHAGYTIEWKAENTSDFRDLELVVQFAETIADYQERAPQLDLLNVLLKSVDTLSAYVEALSPSQQIRLGGLIDQEDAFVRALEKDVSNR